MDPTQCNPYTIVSSLEGTQERRVGVAGFEGLTLFDALTFTDQLKDYSFFRLARTIVSVSRRPLHKTDFSVLELGCGSEAMRTFLSAFGIHRYLGVDANPVAFRYSPHIKHDPSHFRLRDLQEAIDFGTTFDVVCSFEFLKHVLEDRIPEVIGTIHRHMGSSSLFLGTASLGSYADVHWTVRDGLWWMAQFREGGFRPHREHAECEETLACNHPFNWTVGTTTIFALESADSRSND
jgi:SAM-dependent methyltransferase